MVVLPVALAEAEAATEQAAKTDGAMPEAVTFSYAYSLTRSLVHSPTRPLADKQLSA